MSVEVAQLLALAPDLVLRDWGPEVAVHLRDAAETHVLTGAGAVLVGSLAALGRPCCLDELVQRLCAPEGAQESARPPAGLLSSAGGGLSTVQPAGQAQASAPPADAQDVLAELRPAAELLLGLGVLVRPAVASAAAMPPTQP